MPYSQEVDVIEETGFANRNMLVEYMGKTDAEITAFIEKKITQADSLIQRKLRIPLMVLNEEHLGNGRTLIVPLGPRDETHGIYFDPTDCVVNVTEMWYNGHKVLPPFPDNCELGTQGESAKWEASNCTVSDDTVIFKTGKSSLKSVFNGAGYIGYDKDGTIDRNMFPWYWIGFYIRSSDASVNFQFQLLDVNNNANVRNFTVDKANVWKWVRLNALEFTGSINYVTANIFQLRITTDKACTINLNNLNFNDGWCWSAPSGTLNYGRK